MSDNLAVDLSTDSGSIGHNIRPLDLARERVDALTAVANEWLAKVPEIMDEPTAKRADDFLTQIQAELKKLGVAEKAEKNPLRNRIAEIGLAYAPLTFALNTVKNLLSPKIAAWLRRKQVALEAEKVKQREEAARLAREAAAMVATRQQTVEQTIHAQEMAEAAEEAAKRAAAPVERAQVRGDYSGRARSVRTLWRAEIIDQLLVYVYYAEHPDVIETLQRLVNAEAPAAHKEKREIPGCRFIAKEIAA